MLLSLSIKNYALIEDLNLDFGDGFTVISGETGAGKSIFVKAIELIAGARADISSIRSGCDVCSISAAFEFSDPKIKQYLQSLSIPYEDNSVIVRRTIEKNGKSKAFINDSPVAVSSLASIGNYLIDFHGQNEKFSLNNQDSQLEILDKRTKCEDLKKKAFEMYGKITELKSKINSLDMSEAQRERKIDLYSFQINEIKDACLENGEDEKIDAELPLLKNAEKISALCAQTVSLLYSGENAALNALIKAKKNMETINSLGVNTGEILSLIEQSYYQAQEAYIGAEDIVSKAAVDPEKLNNLLERAELIKKLKKKYGATIEEILNYQNDIEKELETLSSYKENTDKLEKELASLEKEMDDICAQISVKRKKAAEIFCRQTEKEFKDLGMADAVFKIDFVRKNPSPDGYDEIEFMFCANKGEKILPLRNTASGGELSRVLLAIEISSGIKNDKTMIFDEIDTGTGGKTGEKIGKKLSQLAKNKQVFSITHLAQVTAFAKTHIKIYKQTVSDRTYTKAKTLSLPEHIEETARMISGEKITEAALEQAKNLINVSTGF